jgi:hypothetical protein
MLNHATMTGDPRRSRMTTSVRAAAIAALVGLAALLPAGPAAAFINIVVNNKDAPGEGFNDPTVIPAAGGNPATTRGAARLIALRHAAFIWGLKLTSPKASAPAVQIDAKFDPQPCSVATGFVLGSAAPTTMHKDFPSAPLAGTFYPQALANAIAGFDQDPATADITATFNADIDGGCIGGVTGWYYGVDGNPPGGQLDFVTTALHELAHGLGFKSHVNLATGEKFMGADDVYSRLLERHGASPAGYPAMTNAQRIAASTSDPNLHWTGASANAAGAALPLTAGMEGGHIRMYGPNPQDARRSVDHFSDSLVPAQLLGPFSNGVNHDPGLALDVLKDLGWSLGSVPTTSGVDVVFLMDVTGSTGALLPGWVAQIPQIAKAWKAAYPNARFAVASHADYPFSPFGNPGDYAYRLDSNLSPNDANLTAALGLLTQKGGNDAAESQYEAIHQLLFPENRDLAPPENCTGPGEFCKQELNQIFPLVIYHFTFPDVCGSPATACFHDRDLEPNYPVPVPSTTIPGRTAVLTELAARASGTTFIGLTFVSGPSAAIALANPRPEHPDVPIARLALSPALRAAAARATTGTGTGTTITATVTSTPGPLADFAALTGGKVYDVKTDLTGLLPAIDDSIKLFKKSPKGSTDLDEDGVLPPADNCPMKANIGQEDGDGDKVGDACDNCPAKPNPTQRDSNANGTGDECDPTTPPPPPPPPPPPWWQNLPPWAMVAAVIVILILLALIFRKK